jgi:dTDP-4-amino-4,6-dideoxygalactose transaminase
VLAAFLFAQLEHREEIQIQRRRIWESYHDRLCQWAKEHRVGMPFVPKFCEQSWHMFYLLMPTFEARGRLIAHLKARGILSVFHYLPLHLSEMGQQWGGQKGDCPVTESVSERLVRLPFYNELNEEEQGRVVAAVSEFQA